MGVLFLHVAKLLVLGRMLQFVSRAKSSRLLIIRRSQRAFVAAVVLVDLVRLLPPPLAMVSVEALRRNTWCLYPAPRITSHHVL